VPVLTEHDLQELIGFRSLHPVLSVYLHVDPTGGSSDTHKLRLRQMLKELGDGAAVDAQAVQNFVEHEYGWSSRSLALFTCTFFRAMVMVPLGRALRRPPTPNRWSTSPTLRNIGVAGGRRW
jgi:hypothetical protein